MDNNATKNQLQFVEKYNKLHEHLQKLSKNYFEQVKNGEVYDTHISREDANTYLNNNFIPFMKSVHVLAKSNKLMKERLTDLYKINDLRNLIVHEFNKFTGNHKIVGIAEPTEYSLVLLDNLLNNIVNPMTVKQYIQSKNKDTVQVVFEDTSIYKLLDYIHSFQYTQFPVFDSNNNFKGIVSDNGLAYWFSKLALDEQEYGSVELSESTVGEVITLDETRNEYKIVDQDEILYNILSIFDSNDKNFISPIILVSKDKTVTADNLSPENLVAIITSYDYADIHLESIK